MAIATQLTGKDLLGISKDTLKTRFDQWRQERNIDDILQYGVQERGWNVTPQKRPSPSPILYGLSFAEKPRISTSVRGRPFLAGIFIEDKILSSYTSEGKFLSSFLSSISLEVNRTHRKSSD